MKIWITDSLERVLPKTKPGSAKRMQFFGARNQIISFQVGFVPLENPAENAGFQEIKLSGMFAKYSMIRLAGLVPLRNHSTYSPSSLIEGDAPGFIPDVLTDDFREERFEKRISRSYWITVKLPDKAMAGNLKITIKNPARREFSVEARIKVLPLALKSLELPITHWFYNDAILDWYGLEPFSRDYWKMVEKYFRNMTEHNQTAIYTPLFTPPLDGIKRDFQLVDVSEVKLGKYRFGWSKLKKWVDLAKSCGFKYFEMSHLFSQWGAKFAIRVLINKQGRIKPLCQPNTLATGKVYRNFLEQFLSGLIAFLKEQGIFEHCIFHLSDEPEIPHIEQYGKVRQMIRAIAPEIRITEALSSFEFYRNRLVDEPVPNIGTIWEFIKNGVNTWTYYCNWARLRFPNRQLDFPLYRLRILGLQMFRFKMKGFLHWGLNYWYKHATTELINPFLVNDGQNWPVWFAGDTFVLYPGKNGPLDSIRWEVYRELFDDYRLLCAAGNKAGEDKIMDILKDIHKPDEFPQNADYIRKIRSSIFEILS
ncbi:MAG: DUF4091 domain-containing protein [Sedimentisphaerales bacterium]